MAILLFINTNDDTIMNGGLWRYNTLFITKRSRISLFAANSSKEDTFHTTLAYIGAARRYIITTMTPTYLRHAGGHIKPTVTYKQDGTVTVIIDESAMAL